MSVTFAGTTGILLGVPPLATLGQSFGPAAASSTSHRAGSSYQVSEVGSQLDWPWLTPVSTAGRFLSGVTSAESRTSNTSHVTRRIWPLYGDTQGPLDATRRSAGSASADRTISGL